jgi:hypothetical protein
MAFTHGNKFGAKSSRKGIPNKATQEIRNTITDLLHKEFSNIEQYKKGLTNKEWLDVLLRLAPYGVPRLTESSLMIDQEQQPTSIPFSKWFELLGENGGNLSEVVEILKPERERNL